VLAGVRGLEAWRSFRRLKRLIADGVAGTTARLETVEVRLNEAEAATQRLEAARTRLQESLATAAVLLAAAGEAKDLVARVRGVVPRK
jgi:hypothetical protein